MGLQPHYPTGQAYDPKAGEWVPAIDLTYKSNGLTFAAQFQDGASFYGCNMGQWVIIDGSSHSETVRWLPNAYGFSIQSVPTSSWVQLQDGRILDVHLGAAESWLSSKLSGINLSRFLPERLQYTVLAACDLFVPSSSRTSPNPTFSPAYIAGINALVLLKNNQVLLLGADERGTCEIVDVKDL